MYLADRPGELAGVLEAAKAAGVEIDALAVGHNHNRGQVRLVGSPEPQLRSVLESLVETGAGPVVEAEVLIVPVGPHAGLIREIAAKLALQGVNIQHAHAASQDSGGTSYILRVSDLDMAEEVLADLAS